MKTSALVVVSLLVAVGCGGLRTQAQPGDGGSGGGTGGGTGAACATLDLLGCRARADCVADLCLECSCAPVFVGCRRPSEFEHQCPLLQCAQPFCCRADAECSNFGAACAPAGAPRGCGACNSSPSQCSVDGDCQGGTICEPRTCGCSGERDCVAGCGANVPCATGQSCVNKRCVATACATAADCGVSTFDCVQGACARRTCTTDATCGGGFCVLGVCEEGLGECRQPVP
ncbi:MAG: hypothetical protein U0228_35365 [Myxococcaceae bacterium]